MSSEITVVGLGPGNPDHISRSAWQALESAENLWLRTAVHPTVEALTQAGIPFQSFDDLYEQAEDFDSLYDKIVTRLIATTQGGPVTYAVPGHPLVAETTVTLLLERAKPAGIRVQVIPSMSCLDMVYARLNLDPVKGLGIYDALEFPSTFSIGVPNLFTQVYNRLTASQLKLALMEFYPDEHSVTVVKAAGVPGEERIEELPLWQLDNLTWLDHLTSLLVPPLPSEQGQSTRDRQKTESGAKMGSGALPGEVGGEGCRFPLDPLVEVMAKLRSKEGCPWDREQTHDSLKRYLIEETYEVIEAIETADDHLFAEELGDVLLQVIFHAQMAKERNAFDINDVITTITEKLVRRHPHVFGNVRVKTADQVVVNWDKIKAGEKENRTSVLDGVPPHLPALMEAEKIQRKAAKVGFDWTDVDEVLQKVPEELNELALAEKGSKEAVEEFGDLLFALANVARHLGIEPETALKASTRKFIRRFKQLEAEAAAEGRSLDKMSLAEMDEVWERVKARERT